MLLNTATPFTEVTVAVPTTSPEESPVPEVIEMVISVLASVTTLPKLSVITTVGYTAEVLPAVPPVG